VEKGPNVKFLWLNNGVSTVGQAFRETARIGWWSTNHVNFPDKPLSHSWTHFNGFPKGDFPPFLTSAAGYTLPTSN